MRSVPEPAGWPPLPLRAWKPTCETLHRWMQVVGKIRLALAPPLNHWWQVPLYVTPRGLTTSSVPAGERSFEILFDLLAHRLVVTASDDRGGALALEPRPVAEFYRELMSLLGRLGIDVRIWTTPVELQQDAIPFEQDRQHADYDPAWATRFLRALQRADAALKRFASRFQGKQSPVHFFWGSFDLACTRFSGRRAPPRPGADPITCEAYSHEVASFGFWPGTDGVIDAAFYAYAAPEPEGLEEVTLPAPARYHPALNEFVLPYDEVRASPSAGDAVVDFFEAAYVAIATLGGWDREELDRSPEQAAAGGAPGAEHRPEQPSP